MDGKAGGDWGYDEETTKKYDELREKGEQLIKERQYTEAVDVWKEIATLRPVDQLPHTRLAGLYMRKEVNQPEKLIEELMQLHLSDRCTTTFMRRRSPGSTATWGRHDRTD